MEKRNNYSPEYKTKIVLEALREEKTVNQLASEYGIHPVMISRWKMQFLGKSPRVFEGIRNQAGTAGAENRSIDHRGGLVEKNLISNNTVTERKAMIEREQPMLPVKRQAELLEVNRTSVYRIPHPPQIVDPMTLAIMHKIDEIYTEHPYYGYRRITAALREEGYRVNRKRVRRLMREMGIEAIYHGPNLSKRYHAEYSRPYLLRNLEITCPDQVWGVDITYIRMQKGFMYLFVIIDWYSRSIVDYELSNTLDKGFVLICLNCAINRVKPMIINSDQGSHFTNPDYINLLTDHGICISMDGKGRATDNGRTERFFRALKYERIYINEYGSPQELRRSINEYIDYYNHRRPHQSLGYLVPSKLYLPLAEKAS